MRVKLDNIKKKFSVWFWIAKYLYKSVKETVVGKKNPTLNRYWNKQYKYVCLRDQARPRHFSWTGFELENQIRLGRKAKYFRYVPNRGVHIGRDPLNYKGFETAWDLKDLTGWSRYRYFKQRMREHIYRSFDAANYAIYSYPTVLRRLMLADIVVAITNFLRFFRTQWGTIRKRMVFYLVLVFCEVGIWFRGLYTKFIDYYLIHYLIPFSIGCRLAVNLLTSYCFSASTFCIARTRAKLLAVKQRTHLYDTIFGRIPKGVDWIQYTLAAEFLERRLGRTMLDFARDTLLNYGLKRYEYFHLKGKVGARQGLLDLYYMRKAGEIGIGKYTYLIVFIRIRLIRLFIKKTLRTFTLKLSTLHFPRVATNPTLLNIAVHLFPVFWYLRSFMRLWVRLFYIVRIKFFKETIFQPLATVLLFDSYGLVLYSIYLSIKIGVKWCILMLIKGIMLVLMNLVYVGCIVMPKVGLYIAYIILKVIFRIMYKSLDIPRKVIRKVYSTLVRYRKVNETGKYNFPVGMKELFGRTIPEYVNKRIYYWVSDPRIKPIWIGWYKWPIELIKDLLSLKTQGRYSDQYHRGVTPYWEDLSSDEDPVSDEPRWMSMVGGTLSRLLGPLTFLIQMPLNILYIISSFITFGYHKIVGRYYGLQKRFLDEFLYIKMLIVIRGYKYYSKLGIKARTIKKLVEIIYTVSTILAVFAGIGLLIPLWYYVYKRYQKYMPGMVKRAGRGSISTIKMLDLWWIPDRYRTVSENAISEAYLVTGAKEYTGVMGYSERSAEFSERELLPDTLLWDQFITGSLKDYNEGREYGSQIRWRLSKNARKSTLHRQGHDETLGVKQPYWRWFTRRRKRKIIRHKRRWRWRLPRRVRGNRGMKKYHKVNRLDFRGGEYVTGSHKIAPLVGAHRIGEYASKQELSRLSTISKIIVNKKYEPFDEYKEDIQKKNNWIFRYKVRDFFIERVYYLAPERFKVEWRKATRRRRPFERRVKLLTYLMEDFEQKRIRRFRDMGELMHSFWTIPGFSRADMSNIPRGGSDLRYSLRRQVVERELEALMDKYFAKEQRHLRPKGFQYMVGAHGLLSEDRITKPFNKLTRVDGPILDYYYIILESLAEAHLAVDMLDYEEDPNRIQYNWFDSYRRIYDGPSSGTYSPMITDVTMPTEGENLRPGWINYMSGLGKASVEDAEDFWDSELNPSYVPGRNRNAQRFNETMAGGILRYKDVYQLIPHPRGLRGEDGLLIGIMVKLVGLEKTNTRDHAFHRRMYYLPMYSFRTRWRDNYWAAVRSDSRHVSALEDFQNMEIWDYFLRVNGWTTKKEPVEVERIYQTFNETAYKLFFPRFFFNIMYFNVFTVYIIYMLFPAVRRFFRQNRIGDFPLNFENPTDDIVIQDTEDLFVEEWRQYHLGELLFHQKTTPLDTLVLYYGTEGGCEWVQYLLKYDAVNADYMTFFLSGLKEFHRGKHFDFIFDLQDFWDNNLIFDNQAEYKDKWEFGWDPNSEADTRHPFHNKNFDEELQDQPNDPWRHPYSYRRYLGWWVRFVNTSYSVYEKNEEKEEFSLRSQFILDGRRDTFGWWIETDKEATEYWLKFDDDYMCYYDAEADEEGLGRQEIDRLESYKGGYLNQDFLYQMEFLFGVESEHKRLFSEATWYTLWEVYGILIVTMLMKAVINFNFFYLSMTPIWYMPYEGYGSGQDLVLFGGHKLDDYDSWKDPALQVFNFLDHRHSIWTTDPVEFLLVRGYTQYNIAPEAMKGSFNQNIHLFVDEQIFSKGNEILQYIFF